jgi:DNA-binding GntR family transcriptional regulator
LSVLAIAFRALAHSILFCHTGCAGIIEGQVMDKITQPKVAERPGLDVVIGDALKERILSTALPPGSHLVEVDFAKEFSVAHGTIRSAFRHLQAEGLVEYRPRRGMFVTTIEPDDVLELCSLRDSLEALGSGLAAKNGRKSDQVALRAIVNAMREAAENQDRRRMIELDLAFHVLIVEMSGHRRLQQVYSMLASQVRLFMALTDPLHADLHGMVAIHEALAAPILEGDSDRASLIASTHNQPDGVALAAQLREAQRRMSRKNA